jgi:NAD(P)-dependent dehydrogenase (short-subunit alcohol dehydrogenase family)
VSETAALGIEALFGVRGKVVLVTGGSRGIGEMIARGYVENGARVYLTARKAAACDALAQELSARGECISIPADLSMMAEIERLGTELERRESRLHVLVNNAGAGWQADFATFPESGWDKVMDLNVKSPFFLTQRLAPLLEAASTDDDWARVINIGSVDGLHVSEIEHYPYSASKAGALHLTRVLARWLARRNIAVNAIAPGHFPSQMTLGLPDRSYHDRSIADTPMRRWGRAEDMAGAALYLGSKASGFVDGAVLAVDGGDATTR